MFAKITATYSLSGFDLDFNGAFSQETLDEVTSGRFIDRGEHLLLVGGNGTGKTEIARCAQVNAKERDLTSELLWAPSSFMAHDQLVDQDVAIGHLGDGRIHYRAKLLDADVLIVDELEKWLEVCPVAMLGLLGLRAERGKSNVLVFTSKGWTRACEQELRFKRSFEEAALQTSFSLNEKSTWPRTVFFGGAATVGQLLKALGIDINDSRLPRHDAVRFDRPLEPRLERTPVWTIVHTGDKSYRGRA